MTSVEKCTQLVLHVQPVQLVVQEIGESAVILLHVTYNVSSSIPYLLELVCGRLGCPSENGIAVDHSRCHKSVGPTWLLTQCQVNVGPICVGKASKSMSHRRWQRAYRDTGWTSASRHGHGHGHSRRSFHFPSCKDGPALPSRAGT